jgi:hypothetical protein
LNINKDSGVFGSLVFSFMGMTTEILEKSGMAKTRAIKKILISFGKLGIMAELLAEITSINES